MIAQLKQHKYPAEIKAHHLAQRINDREIKTMLNCTFGWKMVNRSVVKIKAMKKTSILERGISNCWTFLIISKRNFIKEINISLFYI